VKVAGLCARARVSPATFRELFGDLKNCFTALLEQVIREPRRQQPGGRARHRALPSRADVECALTPSRVGPAREEGRRRRTPERLAAFAVWRAGCQCARWLSYFCLWYPIEPYGSRFGASGRRSAAGGRPMDLRPTYPNGRVRRDQYEQRSPLSRAVGGKRRSRSRRGCSRRISSPVTATVLAMSPYAANPVAWPRPGILMDAVLPLAQSEVVVGWRTERYRSRLVGHDLESKSGQRPR
jgi:hypothetical protein